MSEREWDDGLGAFLLTPNGPVKITPEELMRRISAMEVEPPAPPPESQSLRTQSPTQEPSE